ncbi:unnamed protein product [Nezara viridula]|uniref:PHD-type domain-containing protein n=1 Tax=Nezara viridula TaxID=85310 RepID=A0A9P0HEZ3_NEZVI|nr:unnamed protein product [Nezara viridula]
MATETEASLLSCASDPNFAVICSFLNQFAASCGIAHPTFSELQDMLEDTDEVSQVLIDIHIKLLRKARKSFTADKWEKALARFCHTYSQQDGWELERFGYKKARLSVKVKLLKVLLETQFDVNGKFKSEVNKVGAKDLRLEPLGRDQSGFQYWCQFDKSSHVRIYREDVDDETWELVASDRDGLVQLIDSLSNGEGQLELNSILNEDSTSQEIEKPITDTGQEEDKQEEAVNGNDEDDGDDEEEEEEEIEEEEEEVEEEEEEEGDEEGEEVNTEKHIEQTIEQKVESVPVKSVVAIEQVSSRGNLEQEKPVELTNASNMEQKCLIPPVEENMSSLTGVDLSIKSDSKRYSNMPNDFYASERPYMPERNDILSQMSARFNDTREAEDLSFNPAKKLKLDDDDQPMMLVKKDIVVSDAIEEPVRLVTGPGSGEDCQLGNPGKPGEPIFSEVIEEPVQYFVGAGSGVECDVANPKYGKHLDISDSECSQNVVEEEPEFSEVIEEPMLFIVGLGSGEECGIGNPRLSDESKASTSYSSSTQGIECSLGSLSLATREPKFSDVIEEPVMFVHGSGYGQDCLTGNPDEVDESIDDKSPEKKPKLWSIDAICSPEKLLNESLKQNSSGSSQKDPDCDEGSSKMSEGFSALNCTKENVVDEENVSGFNLSNNINSSLKPFSGVKPILENIPMKDKPPDSVESDTGSFVPELSNDISSHSFDKFESNSNCISNIDEEIDKNQVLNSDSVPSSKIDQVSSDISSSNCTSDEKSTTDDQPSTINCSINNNALPVVTESNVKSFSEDDKKTSIISEDVAEDKNPNELFDSSLKPDVDSHPNVNSAKLNNKKSKSSKSAKKTVASNSKNSTNNISDGEINCEVNNSLIEKCENDNKVNSHIIDKNTLTNCENGSKLITNCSVVCEKLTDISLASQNLSVGKTSKPKRGTVSSSGADQSKSGSDKSNSAALDKNEEKRKNVMLTNIIEVCLDNDNYSKDDAKSGLKGQLNAKFNDLFSAKNLLEPATKSSSKETCNDLNEVPTSSISENSSESDSSDENIETPEEQKINPDVNVKNENSDNTKQEENINEERLQNILTSKSESESKIKSENGDSIKLEEIKEENSVRNVTRGRKSRTNSLNNDEETEIPNKIRKTDSVPATKARRVTRRNASSTSQNDVCSEPVDDKVVNAKGSRTKSKNDSSTTKDPIKELNINEEKTENNIEQKNENDKAVDDEIKVEVKKEDETTNIIPKTETDEADCKSNEDNEDASKKSVEENKGFTLASFSLEQPLEDGPVLGKPPDFKSQPSRKRRNSRKMSRSEEDGGEVDDNDEDAEEAGGKRPRLRAKTRRSKGTPPSTKHVQPEASSSDDNQAEENTDANSKDKQRSRGRPMKKKGKRDGPATSKSKSGKAKETEKSKEKESEEEEESESEKEDAKRVAIKKETRKKQQSNKEESEKEEKKQLAKKSNEKDDKKQLSKKEAKSQSKGKSKSRGRPKKELQSNKDETGDDTSNEAEEEVGKDTKTEVVEVKGEEDDDSKPLESDEPKPKKKGRPKKQKTLLGLMESDLIHSKPSPNESEGSRVRQSRRIAQIKIKEEAERRAIEEATMMLTMKEVKKKPKEESKQTPKKHKNKKGKSVNVSEEEDETFKEPVEEKKKGRKKKKKKGLTYDINKPWQSSSDDSSEEAEEEEEHFEEEDDEEDIRATKVVSDHEFSPESDLEKDETIEPIRRARTAKKADEDEVKEEAAEVTEDYPCKKCGEPDHPEWILLCDKCDSGYHASCLRPTIMLIPEGDWFCPPCQHLELVSKLKETLRAFEKNTKRRENEELRKKRLAYVGISLANVLPTQEKSSSYSGGRRIMSESSESSSEESESSDEEPVYQLRQRRAALQANYRFNDYDDLINSAIQDEMEAVKGAGNMGRGKDIANIVEAEKKAAQTDETANVEEEPKPEDEEEQGENWRPPVVPKNTSLPSLRKKPKKLTDLDKQSEDDADSDEDFKGSSDEEEFSSTEPGDSDDSIGRRQPVRRSSRARISRIDKEFINDDSESSDEPRRKKTRRIWASSSSESSDTTWGRRKRKTKTYSRIRSSRSSKKKKKMVLDSDSDRPKKTKIKRPKIRYGLSEDEGEPLRRTRGKKMSYLEVAGSDTEEEVIARSRKLISEDEEEFVPEKEEVGGDEENEPEEVEPVEEVEEEEEEEEEEEDEDEDEEEDEAEPKPKPEEKAQSETTEKEKKEPEKEKTPEKETVAKVPVPETQNKEEVKEPVPLPVQEAEKAVEDDEDDDQVEEEEIEEEVEEEVEEEEEEEEEDDEDDSQIEEVKNLVREKVEEPKGIIQPPIKIGSGVSIIKVPMAPTLSAANSNPTPQPPAATAIPTPVIKEEKKEEKKEPTPAIRLVPSAKLLDPNKRRPPEESVIRGMLGGGGYYRPQPMQAPGRQPFRQRFPEQQRYLYQPPPASHHQFYPGGAFYAGEDYVVGSGYEEQIDPNVPGGDEEGVFSGLVSYFSSQREDNLDS